MIVERVLDRLSGVRRNGRGWQARCPAHADSTPSLSIALGNDGRILLYDHGGCTPESICDALGFRLADLFAGAAAPRNGRAAPPPPRAELRDLGPATSAQAEALVADGRVRDGATLARMGARHVEAWGSEWLLVLAINGGGKVWGVDGNGRIRRDGRSLTRRNVGPVSIVATPDLRDRADGAEPIERLYDLEGESDLLAWLDAGGVAAIASTGGAASTAGHERHAAWLRSLTREVAVIRDRDDAGRKGAETAAAWWSAQGVAVRVVELPAEVGDGGDTRDYLRDLGGIADLDALADAAARREPKDADTDARTSTEGAWEPLVPFDAETTGPALALEALPEPVGAYVGAVSEVVDIAPDFVAACALGILAAASGRRAEVAIGETHVEPLALYLLPTLPPGERKVALRRIVRPLEEAERALAVERQDDLLRNRTERAITAKRCEALERDAAKCPDAAERAAVVSEVAALRAGMPDELVPPRLVIDDATPEATGRVLAEQGGVCAVVSEEAGALFEVLAGKYQQGQPALDVHLKAYDGGEIRVHRITRDPLHVSGACLSIVTTPQPALLDRIAELPDFRGRGLLGRICIVMPESRVGDRLYQNRCVPETAEAAWGELICWLARLPIHPSDEVPRLRIEGEALALWARYADALEREQAEGGPFAGLRDWASKHAGRAARIAGLYHLVRHRGEAEPWEKPVGNEDVVGAWVVADWLSGHARAAQARMGATPDERLARRLLRWIRRQRREVVSLRDVHQAHRDVGHPDALRPGLEVLEARGFLRRLPDPPRPPRGGRPPSPRWEVRPEVVGGFECFEGSEYGGHSQ